MAQKARLFKKICMVVLSVSFSTLFSLSREQKAELRIKNSLQEEHYYNSFYWHCQGENVYDEDNWIQVGPKYLMDGLLQLVELLKTTNDHLKTVEDLIKAGKVTIINIDGTHIQKIMQDFNIFQDTLKLLNINHYQGTLLMNTVPASPHANSLSPDLSLQKLSFFHAFIALIKKITSSSYKTSYQWCSSNPYIIVGGLTGAVIVFFIIRYFKKLHHLPILDPAH
jgi:hypothetical protein